MEGPWGFGFVMEVWGFGFGLWRFGGLGCCLEGWCVFWVSVRGRR